MGLDKICPKRKNRKGPRPNITGCGTIEKRKERYKPWKFPKKNTINEITKKKLIKEALKIILTLIMTKHIYIFDGKLRMQSRGGPIGMELTGVLANVFMVWWDRQFKRKTTNIGLNTKLYERYVDDINVGVEAIEIGSRFSNGTITINEKSKEEDKNTEKDERTMKIIKQIGDSIHPSIQLEVDYPSNNEDRKLRILDLKVWIERIGEQRLIVYEHYSKEVSSKAVINAKSAMSENTKRTILSQEMLRIMTHCSRNLPDKIRNSHINEMMKRIQSSGYNKEKRYDIINSALRAYGKLLEKERNEERPLHRPKDWNRGNRTKDKREKTKMWYKKGGAESVIFVPYTYNSELKKRYERKIKESNVKIKVMEKPGRSLKSLIQKPDPFKRKTCDRDDCFICKTNGKGNCTMNNVCYSITCGEECGKKDIYIGETSYNGYTRGKQHQKSLKTKNKASILWKHCVKHHKGKIQTFKMNVTGSYGKDAMIRQITEGVKIENTEKERTMNDKTEWNIARIPRNKVTSY